MALKRLSSCSEGRGAASRHCLAWAHSLLPKEEEEKKSSLAAETQTLPQASSDSLWPSLPSRNRSASRNFPLLSSTPQNSARTLSASAEP